MKKNIGNIERVVRVILGILVVSLAFVGPRSPWAFLGIIPILTGVIGYCLPYALFGIDTTSPARNEPRAS
ncbi:MAG: DUF2892 domain-containing protein [Acidobacteriota bacterium]